MSEQKHPSENSSLFSNLFFSWSLPYFYTRYKNKNGNDSYSILSRYKSKALGDKLEELWRVESLQRVPSLQKALWKRFYSKYLVFLVAFAINELGFKMIQPYLINKLLCNYNSPEADHRYLYGLSIVFCNLLSVLLGHWYYLGVQSLGLEVKTSCCSLIYRKTLKLAPNSKEQAGKLVNIVSNDAKRFDLALMYLTQLPVAFLETVVIMVWLYFSVGLTVAGGILFLVAFMFLQVWLGNLAGRIRSKLATKTDERIRLLGEFLCGITPIKMCSWEQPFAKSIDKAREEEMKYLTNASYIHAFNNSFMLFINRFGIFWCVLAYTLYYGRIDASYVYTVTAFFSILRQVLTVYLPFGLNNFGECKVSVERIRTFLLAAEIVENASEAPIQELDDDETAQLIQRFEEPEPKIVIDPMEDVEDKSSEEMEEKNKNFLQVEQERSPSRLSQVSSFEELKNMEDSGSVVSKNSRADPEMFDSDLLAEEIDREIIVSTEIVPEEETLVGDPVEAIAEILEESESKLEEQHDIQEQQDIEESQSKLDEEEIQNGPRIVLKNASVELPGRNSFVLQNINFKAKPGDFIAIIGSVGSGKSTFLQTILQETWLKEGTLEVNGTLSYVPQEPWLFPGTIRENILLGNEFNDKKYQQIVRASQLAEDFKKFPGGDSMVIGNDTLSGGQRTRVNFARALYRIADFYLLDDPFSAVDVTVGKKMMKEMLNLLNDKCIILVTHQQHYLDGFSRMYELADGNLRQMQRNLTIPSVYEEQNMQSTMPERELTVGKIDKSERSHEGSVDYHIYTQYISMGNSSVPVIFLVILFVLAQILTSFVDYFLASCINQQSEYPNYTPYDWMHTYSGLIVGLVIISIHRSFYFFRVTLNKSKQLHGKMLNRLMKAPLSFFQSNPIGRIQNRFTKDLGSVDENIPQIAITSLQITCVVLGSFSLIIILNPWNLIPTIIMLSVFIYFQRVFLWTSRNLKRMELISFSPILTHLSTTLLGLATLRAFKCTDLFKRRFDYLQDAHTAAFYAFLIANRAFGFWLDFICTLFMGLVVVTILQRDDVGSVGLAIIESLNLIGLLQFGIRQWGELENRMTSVERVMEYCELPLEKSFGFKPTNWPVQGLIEYRNILFRLDHVDILKNVTFSISPKEKIGVIGRTGAGKTSLIAVLLRLYEFQGQILIDNVDIKEISLDLLRSQISVIPQKSTLLFPTVRSNLDPLDRYNDEDLWTVLEKVQLKEFVKSVGLTESLSKNGINLSQGQKQLLSLARALLSKNKIVILDEASASVDEKTDVIMQDIVEESFKDCTVITIAHRLVTILNYDRVMVMAQGEIVEFGTPTDLLLQEENSLFRKLVIESGIDPSDLFK